MKTISRIWLHNFMSYADEEVVLKPGLNIIAPKDTKRPHHIGKTTIERALAWVCMNVGSFADVVRFGEERVEVKIEFDDGTTISRVRTDKLNQYILPDGTILDSPGRSLPTEVSDATGIRPVAMGSGDEGIINFAESSKFFLDASGPKRGALIAAMFGADSVRAAQKLAEKERNAHHRRLQDTEKDRHQTEQVLVAFTPLDGLEATHAAVKAKLDTCEQLEKNITTCQRLRLNKQCAEHASAAIDRIREGSEDLAKLYQKQRQNMQAWSKATALQAAGQAVGVVEGPASRAVELNNKAMTELGTLVAKTSTLTLLLTTRGAVTSTRAAIDVAKQDIELCTSKLAEAEASKIEILKALGHCPTCGAKEAEWATHCA